MTTEQAENIVLQVNLLEVAEEAGFDPQQLMRMGVWGNFERAALGVIRRCADCAQSYPEQNPDYRAGLDAARGQILGRFGLPE